MLSKNEIQDILQIGLNKGFDFIELFFEDNISNYLTIIDKEVVKYSTNYIFGLGIRLLKETDEIYIYTNKIEYKYIVSLIEEQKMLIMMKKLKK